MASRFSPELGDCFYGFPQIDAQGVKVAEHSGGTVVDDPSHVDRRLDPADEQRRMTRFLPRAPAAVERPTIGNAAFACTR